MTGRRLQKSNSGEQREEANKGTYPYQLIHLYGCNLQYYLVFEINDVQCVHKIQEIIQYYTKIPLADIFKVLLKCN